MHPLIQQRGDVLAALMVRSKMAREEFAHRANLVMPTEHVRFQVKTKGKAYHVVDLATGKTIAFRWAYKAAVDFALRLEEKTKHP